MDLYSTHGVDLAVLRSHVGHFVEKYCSRSRGEMTPDTFWNSVEAGTTHCWVVADREARGPGRYRAVLATQLAHVMSGQKVCTIIMCAGRGRKDWVHLIHKLADWARSEGCGKFKISARRGWVKDLPMFKIVGNDMEWDLRHGRENGNGNDKHD